MAIFIEPIVLHGSKRIDEIISFHQNPESDVFYQEILVPFFLMLMTVSPGNDQKSTLVMCAPDSEFQMTSETIKGRSSNSQHQHNCFEFTYVLEGNMYQIVEGKRYFYPTGSCCLMNLNTLHTEEFSTDFTCLFLSVSPELVRQLLDTKNRLLFADDQMILDNVIFQFLRKNLNNGKTDNKDFLDLVPKIVHTEQVKLVHHVFEQMLYTLLAPSDGATFRILELLLRLIGILGREEYYHVEHVEARSNMESLLFARIDRILDEQHGRVTHTELADILNYNGSYLGRIVKKYTGQSLFDYSMNFTMEYAAHQLRKTDRSIANIITELNFGNRSHFYKIFKAHFGVTPQQYRQDKGASGHSS